MLRALFLLLLALPAQAHEGCYAPTPQLAILRIAQNAQLARLAKLEEERYWDAALAGADRAAAQAVQSARQRSADEGLKHCELVVAPHAGAPLEAAFQWECEATWSRRATHRVWAEFLRDKLPEPPKPE